MQTQLDGRLVVVLGLVGLFSLALGVLGYTQGTIDRSLSIITAGAGAIIILLAAKKQLSSGMGGMMLYGMETKAVGAAKAAGFGAAKAKMAKAVGTARAAVVPSDPITLFFKLLNRIIDKISDQQILLITFGFVLIGLFAWLDEKNRWLGIVMIGVILLAFVWKVRDFKRPGQG